MKLTKYLAYASLGMMLLGSDTKGAEEAAPITALTASELSAALKQATPEQKKVYNEIKKRKDFKSLPKNIQNAIDPSKIKTEYFRNGTYPRHELPVAEDCFLLYYPLQQEAVRFTFVVKRFSPNYELPRYPMDPKFTEPGADQSYFKMDESNLKKLSPADKEYAQTFNKLMNKAFHFLYTEPFVKLNMKDLINGKYMGKMAPCVTPYDRTKTGSRMNTKMVQQETPLETKMADKLKRFLSNAQLAAYEDYVDRAGTCADHHTYRVSGMYAPGIAGVHWVGKVQPDQAKKTFYLIVYQDRAQRLDSFEDLEKRAAALLAEKGIDVKEVKKLNSDQLSPFHRALLETYAQYHQKAERCIKFLDKVKKNTDKELTGSVGTHVLFNSAICSQKQNGSRSALKQYNRGDSKQYN